MSRIGRFLGDLLPATRKTRQLLTDFYHQDPPAIETHVAEVSNGRLRGFQKKASGSLIFRGVPFATSRRLQAPTPVEPWKGERSCIRFGPACPQPAFGLRMMTGSESVAALAIENFFPPLPPDQSYWYGDMVEEESLNANIYTPSLEGQRPVLVWIHGGGFAYGSNVEGGLYDASQLALDQDVVVVAINYRVGPFGFLHFPDEGITNLGIRDQIAGLEWVKENVSKFGGDPGNVTILGESAGGASVGTLIGSPRARGLFHRAIPMSGHTFNAHPARLWKHFFSCVETVLKPHVDGALTPESMKKVPAHKLTDFMGKAMFKPITRHLGTDATLWQPYRDGDIVPQDGAHSNLGGAPPILTGCNENEWKMFEAFQPSLKSKEKAIGRIVDGLRSYFHTTNKDDKPGDADKWKRHATSVYESIESCRSERGMPTAFSDIAGAAGNLFCFEDANFCLARDAGAFAYNLHFWDDGHGRNLPLLFGFAGVGGLEGTTPERKPPSQEDYDRSTQFQSAVTSFARSGRPSVDGAEWSPYPDIMHLKATPQARPFKSEIVAFQDIKREIVADLGIDTVLPQIIPA